MSEQLSQQPNKKRIRTKKYHQVWSERPNRDKCYHGHDWVTYAKWYKHVGWVCTLCRKNNRSKQHRRTYEKKIPQPHVNSNRPFEQLFVDQSIKIDHHVIWLGPLNKGSPEIRINKKRHAVRRQVWQRAGRTVQENERLVLTCGVECCVALCCLTVVPVTACLDGKRISHFSTLSDEDRKEMSKRGQEAHRKKLRLHLVE